MKTATSLIHLGRRSAAAVHAVNPPLVRASTMLFENLAAFKESYRGKVFETPRYGRSGTLTNFELQAAMAELSGAETCIATGSGLSAISAVLMAHAQPGRQILVYQGVYGPTRQICEQYLQAMGVKLRYFADHHELASQLNADTSLVFVETPASLSMELPDVAAICRLAHAQGAMVACDATWGTPLFFDAHGLGVDIAIHAATKFINGHSDVMLGLLTGSYAKLAAVRRWCDIQGSHAAADACWLALRGLRTLAVRLEKHQASALHIATWLQQQSQVEQVLFPALPGDAGHAIWQSQFSGAAGPFSLVLQECSEADFARFIDGLQLFGLGTSWGGYESLVMPAIPHHLRSLDVLPDEGRMVRLHIGLEDADDLMADLQAALQRLSA
ncbi:cystathionine beta-lyase [Undibacterium sp. JH2W]|uniref:cystathionine beta-lyase n=1 Tax=Undibacterium sp. JH2W TaxID=3413037 RepID=UPI003BF21779